MRLFWFFCLALPLAASAEDLTPRIAAIEIYGVRKTPVQKIRAAIGANEGDPLPASRQDIEDRINKIGGIVASRMEAVCCDQGKTTLYVGVEEKNAPHFEFRPAPNRDITLPQDTLDNYHAFLEAVAASIRGRNADEDLTNGYSLMADPECRRRQQQFVEQAARDLARIDEVLRQSSDSEQRAAAAYLLQYGPRGPRTTKTIVDGLQYALQDVDDAVRENAMRSFKAVVVGARLHPEQHIRIEPTWFVELLNSVVWSDRHNATLALLNLTDKRDPDTLALIRERALPSVIEMARWKNLKHALPAFMLAGRLAGLEDNQIREAWIRGDREPVLQQALHPNAKRLAQTRAASTFN